MQSSLEWYLHSKGLYRLTEANDMRHLKTPYRELLAALAIMIVFTSSVSNAIHLSGGVRAVTLNDELHKYGDEYWLYMSGGNTLGVPVFVGFEPFSPPTIQQVSSDEVLIYDSYLRLDLRPSLRAGVITVLNVRPNHFLGVSVGDVIRLQAFSKAAFWYNQGTGPANIGSIQGWNGYEEQGSFNLTRGSTVYYGTGDYEHAWGYNVVKTLYQNTDLLYEQWGIMVTNLYSAVIWEYRNTEGVVWQDGGILFLDNGTYNTLGSAFSGFGYKTTDGLNCASLGMTIGSSRGQLQLTLSNFRSMEGNGCRRQFGAFDVTGTLGGQAFSGWGTFETQRVSVATTTTTSTTTTSTTTATTATTTSTTTTTTSSSTVSSTSSARIASSLTLLISPNPLLLGQTGTASGTLTDSTGSGIGGRSVTIQVSSDQISWSTAVKLTTAPDGSFSVTGKAKSTGTFYERVVFGGDAIYSSGTSPVVTYVVS